MSDLSYLSANALVAEYRARRLSPVEVTAELLRKIARYKRLNAFCVIDEARAMSAAHASEARWFAGRPSGALDGVPSTIKDVFRVRGLPTRFGSLATAGAGPDGESSPCTERLIEAGAIILGKTTTPEFGWKATGDSPYSGSTLNPWSKVHTSGGSSAGAAASLAAGMGALAVGSDGGGSIRIPASFCGVVGLKPTQGLVPYHPRGPNGTLSHCGPMTRSVEDAALLLQVLSGEDRRDPYALPAKNHNFQLEAGGGVQGLRIAFSPTLGYLKVSPEVDKAVRQVAKRFVDLGAFVEQIDPGFTSPRQAFDVLWEAGAAAVIAGFASEQWAVIDPGMRRAARRSADASALHAAQAEVARSQLGTLMALFHRRFDLLLTPTVTVPALEVGEELSDRATQQEWLDWAGFSYPFNMTRQPAISVPCGLTSTGLPIGFQLVGPLYADAVVLRAASAYEASQPHTPWPMLSAFDD